MSCPLLGVPDSASLPPSLWPVLWCPACSLALLDWNHEKAQLGAAGHSTQLCWAVRLSPGEAGLGRLVRKALPSATLCFLTGIDYKTTTILLDGRRVKLELW